MKKTLFALFLFMSLLAFAQDEDDRITVAVYDFSYNPDLADPSLLLSIKQYLISSLQESGQFKILNREFNHQIEEELALQRSKDFYNRKMIEEGQQLGAKYIITGNVDRLSMLKDSGGDYTSYQASISFLLMFIDVEKRELMASEMIDVKSGGTLGGVFTGTSSSPSSAVTAALKKADKRIKKFIEKYFGARNEVGVISIEDDNGKRATKILISGGHSMGLKRKDKLIVYVPTVTEVGGKTKVRKQHIGKAKIVLVEDESFSLCEVTEGHEKIFQEIQKGNKLYILEEEPKIKLPFKK